MRASGVQQSPLTNRMAEWDERACFLRCQRTSYDRSSKHGTLCALYVSVCTGNENKLL